MEKHTIELTQEEANYLLAVLSKQPWDQVNNLIHKINQQIQSNSKNEESP